MERGPAMKIEEKRSVYTFAVFKDTKLSLLCVGVCLCVSLIIVRLRIFGRREHRQEPVFLFW